MLCSGMGFDKNDEEVGRRNSPHYISCA
jgi:hypothetical protein